MIKDKLINIRVSHVTRKELKGAAKKKGVSLTDLILLSVKKYLKNCTTKKGA